MLSNYIRIRKWMQSPRLLIRLHFALGVPYQPRLDHLIPSRRQIWSSRPTIQSCTPYDNLRAGSSRYRTASRKATVNIVKALEQLRQVQQTTLALLRALPGSRIMQLADPCFQNMLSRIRAISSSACRSNCLSGSTLTKPCHAATLPISVGIRLSTT